MMRVGLVGTYDVENYGDCYFPELWAHILRATFGPVELTLFSPTDKPADILSFGSLKALPDRMEDRLLDAQDQSFDALILTGGETIGACHGAGTYIFPTDTFSAFTRLWLAPTLEAARSREERPESPTKFIAHAVGMEPKDPIDGLIGEVLAGADRVGFRDIHSVGRASQNLAETPFVVSADPMFMLNDLLSPQDWHKRAQSLLPEGYAPDGYIAAQMTYAYAGGGGFSTWIEAVAKAAKANDMPVLLLPVCHFLDDEILLGQALPRFEALGVRAHVLPGRINVKDTAAVISAASAVICSSLHAAVTGVVFEKPIAVLAHSMTGKHAGTLETIGVHGAVTTDPAALPDILAHTQTLDMASAAQKGRALAQTDLDAALDVLKAKTARPTLPAREIIEAAAQKVVAFEREACKGDPKLRLKRGIFSAMRKLPVIQNAYDKVKLTQRLKKL